jgi:signal transduction histidine kinase
MMMTKLYAEKGIEVVNTVDAGLWLNCAPEDVEEIMGSIIDNAFKWAGARIRISAERENGMVVTRVEDDGPGILSDQMASVLAPGVRLDETVSGYGFGLSIASELSALYGGGIELEPAHPHGLTVKIKLPASIA